VRVTLEGTRIYSLDLSVALDAIDGIELAVLNPKVANRFASIESNPNLVAESRRRPSLITPERSR
jgi:hypothetical protein